MEFAFTAKAQKPLTIAEDFGKAYIKEPGMFFQDKNNQKKVKLETSVQKNNKKFKLPGYSE